MESNKFNKDSVVWMLRNDMSIRDISKEMSIAEITVYAHLVKWGVSVKGISREVFLEKIEKNGWIHNLYMRNSKWEGLYKIAFSCGISYFLLKKELHSYLWELRSKNSKSNYKEPEISKDTTLWCHPFLVQKFWWKI